MEMGVHQYERPDFHSEKNRAIRDYLDGFDEIRPGNKQLWSIFSIRIDMAAARPLVVIKFCHVANLTKRKELVNGVKFIIGFFYVSIFHTEILEENHR